VRKLAALIVAVPVAAFAQESLPAPQQDAGTAPARPPAAAGAPVSPAPPAPAPTSAEPAAAAAAPAAVPAAVPGPPPPPQYPPPPQQAPPAYAPGLPPPPAPPEKERGNWYIGFGLGGGDGALTPRGGLAAALGKDRLRFSGDKGSFNFRIGATASPKLLLGLDTGAVVASDDRVALGGATYKATSSLTYYDAAFMFFPWERGLFLRGGVGLSSASFILEGGGTKTEVSANGLNVLGGVGYAFWLGRSFNLTLNLDGQRHAFDTVDLGGATSWSAWLGLDWY
jgi:hypothetical protein